MSMCKDCVSGVTHEGVPAGKIKEIAGVKTYVAIPLEGTACDKSKAVLFLNDAFGIDLVNNRLLVDDFAKNGFQTYLPDILNGDPIGEVNIESFDFPSWLAKHGPGQTRPPLDRVIAALKEKGVTSFGATGYCFGARYVFDLAFNGVINAAAVSHPSLLKVPEDLEKFKASGVPLLMNSCEVDQAYPAESQKLGDEILGGGKTETENYKRAYFPGCVHGFAVRGDLSIPEVKFGKEQAFVNAVEWFKEKL